MSCARYHELISRYADNEVTARQKQELLHHVEHCRDCAAWLARVRQAEVLLKGVPDTRPSDRVRSAVLQTVRQQSGPVTSSNQHTDSRLSRSRRHGLPLGGLGLGLLLRFDPSPRRIALIAATCLVAVVALTYQLNLLAPWWGYDKLGFEVPEEATSAVSVSPIPAVSSGYKGVGGPMPAPSLVRLLPAVDATDVPVDEPLRVRFDQPMDRTSVENVLMIDPPASGVFSWDADNEVRFSPASPGLLRGITYRVTLSGTARSLAGTPIDMPISWSFHTRDLPTVVPDMPLGFARISPVTPLSFAFSVPMDEYATARAISLRGADSKEIPVALSWQNEGSKLTVVPAAPLPEGKISLHIGALARTRLGETLGRPYEFIYDVGLPTPRLRFAEGRLSIASTHSPLTVGYEAIAANAARAGADDIPLGSVDIKLYALTADRLSMLGDGLVGWPRPLPPGFLEGLSSPSDAQIIIDPNAGAYATAEISGLTAGIYLLAITAPNKTWTLDDWQLLLVADSSLTLVEAGGPFWATGPGAHAWQNAEVSLYSDRGSLLEKGLTGDTGLWFPPSIGGNVSVAIAQDSEGHLAAFRCDGGPGQCKGSVVNTDTSLDLQTDRATYLPGQTVNFNVLTASPDGTDKGTPVAEQSITVAFLMPDGATLSLLNLKPDSAGGSGGLFNLSPGLTPGLYTLRVSSGTATRDFPLAIEPPSNDDLSVYILPGDDVQIGQTSNLTRTVSILGEAGAPAVGAVVTATLRIEGDTWSSAAVKGVTDAQGRATISVTLPAWATLYNDPGIYLLVDATTQDMHGAASSYLDLTSPRGALAGVRQLVSPSLNVAMIAPPVEGENIRLRVVSLDVAEESDLLVLAHSPTGEQASWSLHMSEHPGGDVTLPIPAHFAGGRVLVKRADAGAGRVMMLSPSRNPNLSLEVTAVSTVSPGALLPVDLYLRDKDGQTLGGSASIHFRPVSGAPLPGAALGWEPSVRIDASGQGSATLTSPTTPGLWYVMARAALPDGSSTWAWSVLRVVPGPVVQVPPVRDAIADEAQTVSVVVHNPTGRALSTGLRAVGDSALTVLGESVQRVDLRANAWGRLTWRLLPLKGGVSASTFSFVPSAGIEGSWPLAVQAKDNPRAKITYVSGSASGERVVGVQVPSGLSDSDVNLEIHASTSLLTTLGSIAGALPSDGEGAVAAAARLSARASVVSAYRKAGASVPSTLAYSSVEHSLALQQIYSTQQSDGGWTANGTSGRGASSIASTSYVLLALRQYHLARVDYVGDHPAPAIDNNVLNRGLAYLSFHVARPLPVSSAQVLLDERANAFYVLAMYGMLEPDLARPMIAHAGRKAGEGLSANGQAWLALALLQAGDSDNALAMIDRILLDTGGQARASAPLLEALVTAGNMGRERTSGSLARSDYNTAAEATSRALMDARQGNDWRSPSETGAALWALSGYAARSDEKPQRGALTLSLNDRPVQASSSSVVQDAVSVTVSGDALHAGTNWLKLKASDGRTLYYSLTLRAKK